MARGSKRDLSWSGAIWNAFWARDIEYFPRLSAGGTVITLSSEEILKEISEETGHITANGDRSTAESIDTTNALPPNAFLRMALERGRESLDEVKNLTEYQDQKATRLLIVTSFLSALSGVLFGRFTQDYPVPEPLVRWDWRVLAVDAAYLTFFLFVLSAVSGALVIFHATRTRFKFPRPDPSKPEKELKSPKSHLFFPAIIAVRPSAWAESFVGRRRVNDDLASQPNLAAKYLRNYIGETYLVAAKVADKIRYLEPAQDILSFALRFLLIWLILFGVVNVFVEPTQRSNAPVPPIEQALVPQHVPDASNEQSAPLPQGSGQEGERDRSEKEDQR
jgi:hypothetical protein